MSKALLARTWVGLHLLAGVLLVWALAGVLAALDVAASIRVVALVGAAVAWVAAGLLGALGLLASRQAIRGQRDLGDEVHRVRQATQRLRDDVARLAERVQDHGTATTALRDDVTHLVASSEAATERATRLAAGVEQAARDAARGRHERTGQLAEVLEHLRSQDRPERR